MSISSLQAIIQKYGANFGIDPKASLKAPVAANAPAADASAPTDAAAKKIPLADSVNLSPAAKDFLASHTGPLGQFEMPNMMDDFFSALDGTDTSGSGMGNSLLDYLSNSNGANPSAGGTGNSLLDYLSNSNGANPSAGGTGNSLLDYLSNSNGANPSDGSSGTSPFDFQNPFGIGNSPSQSLDSFL